MGCPAEIKPLDEEGEHREAVHAGGDYKKAFQELFPEKPVPDRVGVSCCGQFALTKDKIREKGKDEYIRLRKWLLDTKLDDSISGRVLEYSWHSKYHFLPMRALALVRRRVCITICARKPWSKKLVAAQGELERLVMQFLLVSNGVSVRISC